MTLLEKIKIENNNFINIHEAPYHTGSLEEKRLWKEKGKPFFSNEILEFWNIYCSALPGEKEIILPEEAERDERRRFIRYPIFTLANSDNTETKTLGGIWIDNVKADRKNGSTAEIHIKTLEKERNLAYPLLKTFIDDIKKNYNHLELTWGERLPQNDPTKFIKNNGFSLFKKNFYNRAILNLENKYPIS
ncbi:MAG: hypothetical protein V1888_03950 [archaeon]